MLLKRAARGQLGLVQAATGVLQEVLGGPRGGDEEPTGPFAEETRILINAKKIALLLMGVAYQKYMFELEKQQEILASITDVIMDIFAMESALLRTQKLGESGKGANAADMTAVLVRDAMAHIDVTARTCWPPARKATPCAPTWWCCAAFRSTNPWTPSLCAARSRNACWPPNATPFRESRPFSWDRRCGQTPPH